MTYKDVSRSMIKLNLTKRTAMFDDLPGDSSEIDPAGKLSVIALRARQKVKVNYNTLMASAIAVYSLMRYTGFFPCSLFPVPCSLFHILAL
ncbi:MAG: hypothetical protein F6K56_19745 [Moorea sp. SIO3G5]|nr:hypothetical protein [Moorena sp. SIO3G5]